MRFNSLNEWLEWQESLHFKAIDLGLERCMKVAGNMGLLSPDYTVITISGTNGKGTCAALLDNIYSSSGYHVGTYTSPHLLRYNERIRINGAEVTDQMLCDAFSRVDLARGDISLTYFEFGTLAALDLFRRSDIQLAILEVGMGGRLDAVNIMDPEVALICSIGLDHEQWLGKTRDVIGLEKAGIMRSARPAVCSDMQVPESVTGYAAEIGAILYRIGHDFRVDIYNDGWDWHTEAESITGLPVTRLINNSLIHNAAGVLMTVELMQDKFPVNTADLKSCFTHASLPGRFQVCDGDIPVILDVAHNRQAAEVLSWKLAEYETTGATHMVIGMLEDKDHRAFIDALSMVVDYWYVVSLEDARGMNGRVIADLLEETGNNNIGGIFDTIDTAMEHAHSRAQLGDRIVVTGSFLTVGAALKWSARESVPVR